MESRKHTKLINFLLEELVIPAAAISLALRHVEQTPSLLPMYGSLAVWVSNFNPAQPDF